MPVVVVDLAGNPNTASNTITTSVDLTASTIVISGPIGTITDEFSIEIDFSENVTGFDIGDVTIENGSVVSGRFTGGPQNHGLQVDPEVGKDVSVSITANVAEDGVGDMNMASNIFTTRTGSPTSEFTKSEAEIRAVIAR